MNPQDSHRLGHRDRLRQRFLNSGLSGFSDYEVVELVLTLAIPRKDVKKPAKDLIARFGNLRGILDAPLEDLRDVNGIGGVTPVALKVVREVASLYLQQGGEASERLIDSKTLADIWKLRIGSEKNELFEVAYLDSGYRLLSNGIERLEEGTLDRAAVYPRKVIETSLRRRAYAIVLAHNHPNGEVNPTEQDKLLTLAIITAADAIGLRVHDHIIVSQNQYCSFRDSGLI